MSDLDGICVVKVDGKLVPADIHAQEFFDKIPNKREVLVTIRRPRSPQHHRWFFAALKLVCENSDRWPDVEILLEDLKFATGHYSKRISMLTGEEFIVVRSISFAAMPQDQFQRFVNRCFDYLAPAIGVSVEELMEQTEQTQRRARSGSER